jgi:hypothetical protein
MLKFVRSHKFYSYHKIGILDILFAYVFVISTMLHCFILRVHLDTLHNVPSPVPDITESEIYVFLVIIIIPSWRCLHFEVVGGLEWSNDPESYASSSIATCRATHAGQVKGDGPD